MTRFRPKESNAKAEEKLQETLTKERTDEVERVYRNESINYSEDDEWMVKYEVNEKGIGRILLPPTLSIILQSDRVSIIPSGGGLFIRSIND
jgi:hypothetical protein